jgi:hypothetical protein
MHIDIEGLKQTARLILKERGINPDSTSAYEVWFRHFQSDTKDILATVEHHDGDILPWLYDTAEIYADPSTNYAEPAGRRVARKLVKQFAN